MPEINDTHASSVANMAIDMMFKAREVLSPATGEPLKVCLFSRFPLPNACCSVIQ